jgi:hypothetical protein
MKLTDKKLHASIAMVAIRGNRHLDSTGVEVEGVMLPAFPEKIKIGQVELELSDEETIDTKNGVDHQLAWYI